MWVHEHVAETSVGPEAIWAVLEGPFAVGSTVVMKPTGQDPIRSVIVGIVERELYADQTEFAGVTLRFSHRLARLEGGGTRVTHRLEIHGDAADAAAPELGPAITADFPQAMAAMLTRAGA